MSHEYPLNVPAPHHFTFAVRDIPDVTVEQRERVLKATHYNEFAFPAGMLTVDMLSDSGTTAMTNHQWASLFLGDEAYGRNTGYYVLLDTFRDIFERGGEKNWKKILDLVRTDCRDVETMMEKVYLPEYEGGLFNGGAAQMERPNTFIIQQGRAAESVLMEIVKKILAARHPGKTVLLASHGCAIRNLLCWAHGWPIERLNDVNWGENTCVSVLEVDESGTPRLLLENDASHLPADCATLGKQDWWRP